jgi:NADP-dependent 3-hydroxy acid dehydrogenase YdfG
MTHQPRDVEGVRALVVGASSGIGRAVAISAHGRGARVALASRRINILAELAESLGGSAHELDVANPAAIESVVSGAAEALGGLDAVVFTSVAVPFAQVDVTDVTTWLHAFTVNAVGASHVLRAALPHLSADAVVLVTSGRDVRGPRTGLAAYHASKAALDDILHTWRDEHPDLAVIRVSVGPTDGTEILRGSDRELLADLYRSWAQHGQVPPQMSTVADVANTLVSLIAAARANPSVVAEVVHLAPRARATVV